MDKNHKASYFPIFLALGTGLGVLFDQLPIFMCIGLALGLILSNPQKSN